MNRERELNPDREIVIKIVTALTPTAIPTITYQLSPSTAVYTISGQCVGKFSDFKKLPHGIYVVGGRKMVK